MTPLEHMARVLEEGEKLMRPITDARTLAAIEDREYRDAEAERKSEAAEVSALKQQWVELRDKLTARMNLKLSHGKRARGAAEAYLEDADLSVVAFLHETGV